MYADADYVAASNDQRSVSGLVVVLSNTAIGLKSNTQRCVTTAACKAEYVALCDTSEEALFTRAVLIFLQPEPSGMRVDILARLRAQMRSRINRVARPGASTLA